MKTDSIRIGSTDIPTDKPIDLKLAFHAFVSLREAIKYDADKNPSGIVGQKEMIHFMLVALLSGAHVLLEGVPGLAKTVTCKKVAAVLGELQYKRVQFVPDIMPSDLLGMLRIEFEDGKTRQAWTNGPVFTNLLLADEINRASAKVQAALLEATGEKQISQTGRDTIPLRTDVEAAELARIAKAGTRYFGKMIRVTDRWPLVFTTMATMNPIEMEGTFALSEAQLDRFMAKVLVPYPELEEMEQIQKHKKEGEQSESDGEDKKVKEDEGDKKFDPATVIYMSMLRDMLTGPAAKRHFIESCPKLAEQIRLLVWFSHARPLGGGVEESGSWAAEGGDVVASQQARAVRMKLKEWGRNTTNSKAQHEFAGSLLEALASDAYPGVVSGSSPRGMERLTEAVLTTAFLNGHFEGNHVIPTSADLEQVLYPILRHRIRLSSSAIASGRSSDQVIDALLQAIRAASNK